LTVFEPLEDAIYAVPWGELKAALARYMAENAAEF
jgi:hypothetical protein